MEDNPQVIEYQIQQIQQVLENMNEQIANVNSVIECLNDFTKLKGGEEVYFPLANGIFAKGKLSDDKILKMNVGADVVVEKTYDEAITLMKDQLAEMDKYKQDLNRQIESLMGKIKE